MTGVQTCALPISAVILDVAHNPHAARALAKNLAAMPLRGRTYAVFAMLSDKDISGVAATVAPLISHWFVCGLEGPRGAGLDDIDEAVTRAGVTTRTRCESVADAFSQACDMATENDRILVFGSFHTVASDRKSTRLNSSHMSESRMPSSA